MSASFRASEQAQAPASASLLPAFESTKSAIMSKPVPSRAAPEPSFLPTPIPTSEANILYAPSSPLPSSPGRDLADDMSEPESGVYSAPSYTLRIPSNGDPILVGRSSRSCDVSLRATNKLISRIHFKIWYNNVDSIVSAECLGWNGFSLHVRGEKYEVHKGQIINFDLDDGVVLDVCSEQVGVEIEYLPPAKRVRRYSNTELAASRGTSPSRARGTESPAQPPMTPRSDGPTAILSGVSVETKPEEKEQSAEPSCLPGSPQATVNLQVDERVITPIDGASSITFPADATLARSIHIAQDYASALEAPTRSAPEAPEKPTDASENIAADSHPLSPAANKPGAANQISQLTHEERVEVVNMVCNVVAFSSLRTVPFRTIHKANVPLSSLRRQEMLRLLRGIPCIGEVRFLNDGVTESFEYYYIPEKDDDPARQAAAIDSRGRRRLRNCRKAPKQYLYKPLQLE